MHPLLSPDRGGGFLVGHRESLDSPADLARLGLAVPAEGKALQRVTSAAELQSTRGGRECQSTR